MEIQAKIAELAEASLTNSSQFLVAVAVSSRNLSKVTVVVDGDQGITIDDCSLISRELSKKLDEMDFGAERYVLEVTTPGLDHPLKSQRQYVKNIGRNLKVHLKTKAILQGKLSSVTQENIVLIQEKKTGKNIEPQEMKVPFVDIEKTFVMISFK